MDIINRPRLKVDSYGSYLTNSMRKIRIFKSSNCIKIKLD